MSLPTGFRLGPYEISALIGQGGMGEVYRATDTNLKRQVAIKVLPEALAADPERLARFQREAELLAALNHPNIAHIHGLERAASYTALVMELVDGDTLAERIARGPIPLEEVLPIAKQIADALEAAHWQGIVHRDLKPANIKVCADGTVKVLDFGLAKAMEAGSAAAGSAATDGMPDPAHVPTLSQSPTMTSPVMTGVGMILGTASYMSPEQAKGRGADKQSDVWAFGVVLYEMLTAQRPFTGDDVADVMASVLKGEVRWDLIPDETPPHVLRLLKQCLQRDRKRRLRDMGDASLELDSPFPIGPSARVRDNNTTLWKLVAGASILLAIAALAIAVRRSQPTVEESIVRLAVNIPEGWRIPTSAPRIGRTNAADSGIAISRDGRQLAFVAVREGRSSLWMRPLDAVASQNLEGTEGASSPFWAPDGKSVGFFADGKLKKIVLSTRQVTSLCDVENPRGGTWNADGVIVFGDLNKPLQRIGENGGSPRDVSTLTDEETAHTRPAFLPDGRHFSYRAVVRGTTSTSGPILVGSIDGGGVTRVLDSDIANAQFADDRVLYARGNSLVAQVFDAATLAVSGEPVTLAEGIQLSGNPSVGQFSVSAEGTLVYRTADAASVGNQFGWASDDRGWTDAAEVDRYVHVDLANDARRAVIVIADPVVAGGRRRLWLVDLDRGTRSRVTSDETYQQSPAWSPDGRLIAFIEGAGGAGSVAVAPADGSTPPRVLMSAAKGPFRSVTWTHDGTALLATTRRGQAADVSVDVVRIRLDAPESLEPMLTSPFDETMPQVSRDGRWLAYQSNESGREEVYVTSFPTPGSRLLISKDGGTMPRWSRNGSALYYVVPEGSGVPTRPGTPMMVQVQIVGTRIQSSAPKVVANLSILPPVDNGWSYAVSDDSRGVLAILSPAGGTTPITVVKNWQRMLQ